MITRFHIRADEAELAALKSKLEQVRWPDVLADARWEFGSELQFMQDLHGYWLDAYDWRREEERLNVLPHYRFERNGSLIHFIHQPGKGPDPLPLIMTHGWPGSFVEMLKILPLLTDPGAHGGNPADAFSLVVPSIPGYGFSDRPTRRGTNVFAVADIWADLMTALGYGRFGAQGGDWGSWISTALGLNYADRLIGIHLNYISTGFRPDLSAGAPPLTLEETAYLDRVAKWRDEEGAYFAIQGTRPQTLAYGLSDSPVGLAAWLIEKFQRWSDCQYRPDEVFSKDELLTNVMIYWLTNTAHSSIRLYSEARAQPLHLRPGQRVKPPCGIVRLPRELPMPPRSWAERAFNLPHWTTLPRGGHFAAMEVPELLAEDIRTFFRPLRSEARLRIS
ncbi:Pimeloyl-ACP methyl ester carboxylesterase [Rhizobiales bacterium GAS191]|nr:Pimeloyl-ACP methyl ester carboxylesterase [Rhizobiales bacterium GAS191]